METFNSSLPFPFSYPITTSSHTPTSCITDFINAGVAPMSRSSSANTWMDSRLWSQLPQNLIDRIIAFLPPPSFFRARSVCKRWYGLLFSTSFLHLYLQLSPSHPCFLFFKHKPVTSNSYIYRNSNPNPNKSTETLTSDSAEGYMFDPQSLTWYRLVFPSCFAPVSSSGGLVCLSSNESGPKCLVLYNPLIGTISQLPPTLRPRLFPSIGMNVTPSSVDIVVAGDDMISPYAVKNLTAESFHIDTGGEFYSLWGTASSLPRLCSFESSQMVYVGSKFYCMNYSPFSVLAYDVAGNLWSKIQAPMRRFLRSPSLIENKGKLMLVAAVEKSKLNVPKSLRMWCLQECGSSWVEIERMPLQLYAQFEEMEGGRGFDCVGHGEFIVIMIRGSNKSLLFDLFWKRWTWIPPCPFVHGELHGFAYEPKLVTPVTGLLDQLTLHFQSYNV